MPSTSGGQSTHNHPKSPKPGFDVSTARISLLSTVPAIITLVLLKFLTAPGNPLRIPLFDASSSLIGGQDEPTIRWDAIHFLSIATKGYEYEQQLAFQPGWQGILYAVGRVWGYITGTGKTRHADGIIYLSQVLMVLLAGWRGAALYKLTACISNKRTAYLTMILYLLAPTPAVLVSPYTEPLYACLTFTGFHQAFRRRYAIAAIFLAGATSLRATGVFAAPVLAAMAIFRDGRYSISTRTFITRASAVAIPCLIVVLPLLAFQGYAYLSFCLPDPTRPWCHYRLPISYSYVQAKYWNIGFLNYWTPAQIPNLVIASPVLAISVIGIYRYFSSSTSLPNIVVPLVVHHAVMTALLVFGSHTQIALRVISTDPVFWWLLADVSFPRGTRGISTIGKVWVWWSVIWGAISIVLWAGHYPPA